MNIIKGTSELIRNPYARSLFFDYAEIAIDSLSGSKVVDTIPVVGTLTKGGQFLLSVRDRLFIRRLKAVLEGIDKVPQEKIDEFLENLEKDKETAHFGEQLLTVIEKTESPRKASIIGLLFKRLLERKIQRATFEFLAFVVARTYIHDLYQLHYATVNPAILNSKSLGMSLSSTRLVDSEIKLKSDELLTIDRLKVGDFAQSEIIYKINVQGMLLAEVIGEYIGQHGSHNSDQHSTPATDQEPSARQE